MVPCVTEYYEYFFYYKYNILLTVREYIPRDRGVVGVSPPNRDGTLGKVLKLLKYS
jgi:hypothetical protein